MALMTRAEFFTSLENLMKTRAPVIESSPYHCFYGTQGGPYLVAIMKTDDSDVQVYFRNMSDSRQDITEEVISWRGAMDMLTARLASGLFPSK
jgi:hypothetical protein